MHLSVDGNLARLPWAAIKDKTGSYLIENYAFSINDVTRKQFIEKPTPSAESANVFHQPLLVGGIRYDRNSRNENTLQQRRTSFSRRDHETLDNLPQSEYELDDISGLLASAGLTMLSKTDANKTQLLRHLEGCDLLRFAGHGYLKNDLTFPEASLDPYQSSAYSQSGLILYQQDFQAPASEYHLFGEDPVDRDLSSIRLAILSGCFTANGRFTAPDGVWGINCPKPSPSQRRNE